jgi:hypothetical protein
VASGVPGASVNDVTDPDWLDELCGTAAFSGVPVTVIPAREVSASRYRYS